MRKADLVSQIADKTSVQKVDVLVVLQEFFTQIKGSVAEGENVYVRGFGSFIAKKRARKVGRNIKKNKAMEIPAHFIPAFKPAKVFMELVKKQLTVTEEGAKAAAKTTKATKTTKTTKG